ncbi:hypothetical protein LX36DRAFT_303824 [Colletotrichum falcatum]|nr:hypothetical protein LX36DRAFT_303824 [Colletotrichum falcatum]
MNEFIAIKVRIRMPNQRGVDELLLDAPISCHSACAVRICLWPFCKEGGGEKKKGKKRRYNPPPASTGPPPLAYPHSFPARHVFSAPHLVFPRPCPTKYGMAGVSQTARPRLTIRTRVSMASSACPRALSAHCLLCRPCKSSATPTPSGPSGGSTAFCTPFVRHVNVMQRGRACGHRPAMQLVATSMPAGAPLQRLECQKALGYGYTPTWQHGR